jgi:hypothetical protein
MYYYLQLFSGIQCTQLQTRVAGRESQKPPISRLTLMYYICNTILLEISNGYVALPGGTMSDVRSG